MIQIVERVGIREEAEVLKFSQSMDDAADRALVAAARRLIRKDGPLSASGNPYAHVEWQQSGRASREERIRSAAHNAPRRDPKFPQPACYGFRHRRFL